MYKYKSLILILAYVLLPFLSVQAATQVGEKVTFVLGQSGKGTFHNSDNTWADAPGKSGWVANEVAHAGSGTNAKIALVSSNDVWSYSGDANYPLRCKMTDLQSIVGSEVRIYNDFIIDQITIEVKNKYGAVPTETSTDNYFRVSVGSLLKDGVALNTILCAQQATATSSAFTEFASYTTIAMTFERSAATTFSRQVTGGVAEEIYLDCKVSVTVKKMKQTVRYAIFTIDAATGQERLLHKKDNRYNESTYTGYDKAGIFTDETAMAELDKASVRNRYFYLDEEQYLGMRPDVPGKLRRMGCVYGFNRDYIDVSESGKEYCFVRVYYTIDYASIPFSFSTPDPTGAYGASYTPEYQYTLRSAENRWKGIVASNVAASRRDLAQHIALIGDPYNIQVFRCNTREGNTDTRGFEQSSDDFNYFDLLYCRKNASSDVIDEEYFSLLSHNTNLDNLNTHTIYYMGPSISATNYKKEIKSVSSLSGTLSIDDNGALYYVPTSGYYTFNGLKLTIDNREDNIQLTYLKYYKDGDNYVQQSFHRDENEGTEAYVKKDVYPGDRVDLPSGYLHPYRKYEYFTSYNPATGEFSGPLTVIPAGWTGAHTIYVRVSWDEENAPFLLSDNEDEHWYYLTIDGKLLSARGHMPLSLETIDENVALSPLHLWKFVRNNDTSIHLINRWYGDNYELTNVTGDLGANPAAYTAYVGPQMMPSNATGEGVYNKWEVLSVTQKEFGLRSLTTNILQTHMNLCDRNGENLLLYYSNPASLESASRMQAYAYTPGESFSEIAQRIGESQLASAVTTMQALPEGTLYGFKTGVSLTGNSEDILVNPANYNIDVQPYVRIRFPYVNGTTGESLNAYLGVRANIAGKTVEVKDVITQQRARAWVTTALNNTDATGIFNLQGHSDRTYVGTLSAQGFNVNTAIAAPTTDIAKFKDCTVTIYPYGLGQGVICANQSSVEGYTSSTDLYLSYDFASVSAASRSVLLESTHLAPTPCVLEPITTFAITLSQIGGTGPSFGSIYLPFDIRLPEGVTAYKCIGINEDEEKLNIVPIELSGQVLPANSPVVLICEDGSVKGTQTVDIVGSAPSEAVAGNLFSGTHYQFTVPRVNESDANEANLFSLLDHDKMRLFGKGGSANVAGFYPFVTTAHSNVPANKAYVSFQGESQTGGVATRLFMMIVDADPADETITGVEAIITSEGMDSHPEFYDLQGRRVSQPHGGVFVVRSSLTGESRKVYIK